MRTFACRRLLVLRASRRRHSRLFIEFDAMTARYYSNVICFCRQQNKLNQSSAKLHARDDGVVSTYNIVMSDD